MKGRGIMAAAQKAGRYSENDSSKNQHSGKENTVSRGR